MILGQKEQDAVRTRLASLTGRVTIVLFEAALGCPYCPQTKQLVRELAELSPLLDVQVYNFRTDDEAVARFGIKEIPALALLDEAGTDFGIRFYGIPSGYEFATLLEDIEMVSTGTTKLSATTVEALAALTQDVHLQVFATPT